LNARTAKGQHWRVAVTVWAEVMEQIEFSLDSKMVSEIVVCGCCEANKG
jgi:hypothetical protein